MIREADNIMTLIILYKINHTIKHLTLILSISTRDNKILIRLFIRINRAIIQISKINMGLNIPKIIVKLPINMIITQWVIHNFNLNFKTKLKIEASKFKMQIIIVSKEILFIKNK